LEEAEGNGDNQAPQELKDGFFQSKGGFTGAPKGNFRSTGGFKRIAREKKKRPRKGTGAAVKPGAPN